MKKHWMKLALPAVSILMVAVTWGVVRSQGAPVVSKKASDEQLKSFMRLKLDHAQGILGGIATEDFEQIAKEVQALNALSMQSSWNAYTTVEYLNHSSDFRRAMDVISKAAHEENIDRAALGYVNLTVQCIECHRYLRHKQQNEKPDRK
jgi:hypothetical protein